MKNGYRCVNLQNSSRGQSASAGHSYPMGGPARIGGGVFLEKYLIFIPCITQQASYNRALPKPKKIACDIKRIREKETIVMGISVERSCKNCAETIKFPLNPTIHVLLTQNEFWWKSFSERSCSPLGQNLPSSSSSSPLQSWALINGDFGDCGGESGN